MPETAELLLDARAELGEGPIWDPVVQRLYWVDILGCRVHVHTSSTGEDRVIQLSEMPGAVAPRASSVLILAQHSGFATLDLDDETVIPIADPEADLPGNRFNDGKCDPSGRFWAGTLSLPQKEPLGALYRLDTDQSVTKVETDITVSNGLTWTADRSTMYYIDTPTRVVSRYDYDDPTGSISNRSTAIDLRDTEGFPDGMTIDAEGMLWVAFWGGWAINRYNPQTGDQIGRIHVPARQVTSCAFGGPELDTLYITTARQGCEGDTSQPHAGSLFVVKPGVVGLPAPAFAG